VSSGGSGRWYHEWTKGVLEGVARDVPGATEEGVVVRAAEERRVDGL